jgi:hypothetical protein
LSNFTTEFVWARSLHKKRQAIVEQEWGVDKEWGPAPWKTAWGRIKADLVVFPSPAHAILVDFKTGRKIGNEIKHSEQLQLYSLATAVLYPKVKTITSQLWYLDAPLEDNLTQLETTSALAMKKFLPYWDKKARAMTSAKTFKANCNKFSCKWCPFKEGQCDEYTRNSTSPALLAKAPFKKGR